MIKERQCRLYLFTEEIILIFILKKAKVKKKGRNQQLNEEEQRNWDPLATIPFWVEILINIFDSFEFTYISSHIQKPVSHVD